jgi:hypothetical protein
VSKFVGDFAPSSVVRIGFNTNDAEGAPITLSGGVLAVHKDGGLTQSTAGVTLTTDFDGLTGYHVANIDTSADAFYASGSDYRVYLTAGTVDGTSVVGALIGAFSIANRNRAGFSLANGSILAATFAAGAIDAAALATDAANEIRTGLSTLDAAGVRTALGLATANLDAQLGAIDDFLDTEVAAILARLPVRPTKNTALANFPFLMVDSTDHVTGKASLTITATRSIDGGAFAACANAASEVANGLYKINLAASDLNGDTIVLRFTAAGADPRVILIVPQP